MKAAVYQGKQRFQVEEIATPVPGPKQILVKVDFCGICGTDVHAFMFDIALPGAVLGHEFSGTVAAVGKEVTEWKVGERVIGGGGEPPAGQEPATRAHPRYNYRTMGFQQGGRTRAYAEYTLMELWEPLRLPKGVPPEAGALCEPSAVAVHAIRLSGMRLGDTVGIIGAGPIGMLCLQAARAAGASRVMVSEPAPARAQAARKLGADLVLDPLKGDVTQGMVDATNGTGPDVVLDCAGIKSTLDQAMNTVRRGGQVTLVAVPWEPLPVLPVDWMAREVKLATSWGARPEDWRIALNLMQTGALSTASIMSEASFVPLDKIQSAFEALMKPSTQLQMVVRP